jgi:hypothetical protein
MLIRAAFKLLAGHICVHHSIPIRRKVMLRVGKTADKREAR